MIDDGRRRCNRKLRFIAHHRYQRSAALIRHVVHVDTRCMRKENAGEMTLKTRAGIRHIQFSGIRLGVCDELPDAVDRQRRIDHQQILRNHKQR